MSLQKIEQLVLQLDSNWFNSKKELFVTETFYSKRYKRIYEVAPYKVDKDLKNYCWSGYYPAGLYAHEEETGPLPINASDVANNILSEITNLTKGITEVKANYIIISTAIDTISNMLEELQRASPPDDYVEFLSFFLSKTKQKISKEYGHYKRAYDISERFKEKLLFDLNQEELAALLYLLYQAGFIHTPTPTDTTFLNFCANHFYFKNQKQREHTPSKKLRDKFNEVKNGSSQKAQKEIINRLKTAFKSS